MQEIRKSVIGFEVEQEKIKKIKVNWAAQLNEKQVVTWRSCQEERAIVGNSQIIEWKIIGSDIWEISVARRVCKDGGSNQKIQWQHC